MSVVASHYLKVTTQQYACYKPQLLALVVARRSKQGQISKETSMNLCVCVSRGRLLCKDGWPHPKLCLFVTTHERDMQTKSHFATKKSGLSLRVSF